jgi:surface polysaccharide O-acyltransferase-like enzyme
LSRNASLDALRVLCLTGIVTLHAAGGGFSDNKALAFVLDELSRFAVPVFFLLSAYFWKAEELASPWQLTRRVAVRVLSGRWSSLCSPDCPTCRRAGCCCSPGPAARLSTCGSCRRW